MRPVAAPYHPLRRRLDESLGDLRGLWVIGRANIAVSICAGQFDPRAAPVDETAQHRKRRMLDTGGQGRMAHVIEYKLRWEPPEEIGLRHNLVAIEIELDVPSEIGDPLG